MRSNTTKPAAGGADTSHISKIHKQGLLNFYFQFTFAHMTSFVIQAYHYAALVGM